MEIKLVAPLVALLSLQLCSCVPTPKKQGESQPTPAPSSDVAAVEPRAAAPLVCIDPGHPSEVNSGKSVQNGTSEVHVAWAVALKLRKILESEGFRVVLTKAEEEQLVLNKERALIANRERAAVMIRLHCDASADRGFAVYYPDRQGTTQGQTGPAPAVIDESRRAAGAIHAGLAAGLADVLKDGGVRGDSKTLVGSKQGALTGSIFSEVPVVTIEMVVLSNTQDAEFIKAEAGQQRMARAIADGVRGFVNPSRATTTRGTAER